MTRDKNTLTPHFKKQGSESKAMVVQPSLMEETSVVPNFRRLTQSSITIVHVVEEMPIVPEDVVMAV